MALLTTAKTAAVVIRNRKSIGKIVLVICVIAMLPVFFSAMLFMEIMSAFEPDHVLKSSQYVSVENTKIYQSLQEVMEPYYEDLYEDMEELMEETIKEYTVEIQVSIEGSETETDGNDEVNGKTDGSISTQEPEENGTEMEEEIEYKTVVVKPTVMRRINYVPENLIIAYLLMNDGIKTDTAYINKDMTWEFIDSISSVNVVAAGENAYWIENHLLTISEIAAIYFPDEDEKRKFTITCEAYGEYFDVANSKIIDEDGAETIVGAVVENFSAVPLYLQYDSAWGNISYGNGTIKKNGCCPTCLAMVFSYLRGETIYPNDVVAWSGNRYYVSGAGTAWSIFKPASEQWGVSCENIGKSQAKMCQALSDGKIIIASMGPGTFTKGGHFIVLTGITEAGKIKVNDPNDSSVKKHSQKEFEVSLILRECKNMWVFE